MVTALLGLATAGCTEAGDPEGSRQRLADTAPGEKGGGVPAMQLDQVVERLEAGRNPARDGYLAQLDDCRKSGAPTTPVPESQESLIGTQRWQLWRDRERFAYRVEKWDVRQPEHISADTLCAFSLQRSGEHGYVDAERSITVDFATGERIEGDGDPNIVLAPVEGANDLADRELARRRGLAGPTAATVVGQPCDRWQASSGATLCVWSGGARWGIGSVADGEFVSGDGLRPDYIVLEAEPPTDGSGDRLQTMKASFGAPLERDDMMPAE